MICTLGCSVLEFHNVSLMFVWKAGETVALVILGLSQEVVSLSLHFGL